MIFAEDEDIDTVAAACDAALYLTAVVEGEGMDRSDIRLPGVTRKAQADESAIIVGKFEVEIKTDQEESIRRMTAANKHSAVILLNGAPVDMTAWLADCAAVLEAWYPGEQGAQAITEILFGEVNPSFSLDFALGLNHFCYDFRIKTSNSGNLFDSRPDILFQQQTKSYTLFHRKLGKGFLPELIP